MNLPPLLDSFGPTRAALHQVAFFAVAPARYQAVGRMGLRAAPGGFGTPEFDGRLARVDGDLIIHEQGGNVATQTITTVRDTAEFLGLEYEVKWFDDFHDPLPPGDPDAQLDVDRTAGHALGEWFGFATEVLERVREHGTEADEISETQLWPEHFDLATELGSADLGQRASFGASSGDHAHQQPYFYVAAWGDINRSDGYWNAESFNGSSLSYQELSAADDPAGRALDFLLEGYRILHAG